MKYLAKKAESNLTSGSFSYENRSNRVLIKSILLAEQHRYCAYSEKYICEIDESHIEHFDPRLKGTEQDGYYNWYAALAWMNSHKAKKIEPYLPILSPHSPDIKNRIQYNANSNLFESTNLNDVEANNLIKFLGFNKNELAIVRAKHIKRIRQLVLLCNTDIQGALQIMEEDKDYFSFATALEAVLGIVLTPYSF